MKTFKIDRVDLKEKNLTLVQHVVDVLFAQEDPRAFTAASSAERHVSTHISSVEQVGMINDFARAAGVYFEVVG